jgi:hypothetical protein
VRGATCCRTAVAQIQRRDISNRYIGVL